ncbi:MAG: glycosyltransferase [Candidatus Aenigmarchaeota archaeon]|nr:glycosyltransferase [Candidatus Aenigmarchaeota archaeon]
MRISVVIPTLNEGKYIETTLFHLKQLKPYEIIVADSRSGDNTVKIAKKYGCRIVYAKRGAASFGRNAGGFVAKGDLILFLDADTIVFPNMLDVIKKDFKNKKLVGWTCSAYGFSPSWKEQIIYNMSNTLVNFLINYFKTPHAPGIAIAVRRKDFKRVNGFDENLKVMEDHDFAMRVGKFGKFKFSKETCVFTSTRRMDKWGGWNLIKRYSKVYVKFFLNRSKFRDTNMKKIEYEAIR